MNWIQHPLVLEGERVKLVPLDNQYFEELINISTDKQIWQYLSKEGYDRDILLTELRSAVLTRLTGDEYPFVIIDKLTNKIIGSTRYMDMYQEHRKLEIGWTWYHPTYWATGYNTECKLLLLTYAFETMRCIRVQLKTWDKNLRSRAAIQKIGAQFEGILRQERIRHDGFIRDTAVYSIIDKEWEEVKEALKTRIQQI